MIRAFQERLKNISTVDYPHLKAPRAVERFTRFTPLWLALGVDLRPFLRYLEGYEIGGDPLLEENRKERDRLIDVCTEYVKKYDEQSEHREIADELTERLFTRFEEDSIFIRLALSYAQVRDFRRCPALYEDLGLEEFDPEEVEFEESEP